MKLLPPQNEVLESGLLDSGFSCILQMPTGSGKTWLSEQAMAGVLERGQRAIYLAPLRALAMELASKWQQRFSVPVGVFTGDFGAGRSAYPVPFAQARLLVMTPERLDACTRRWRSHWDWLPEVDLVVVDELHLLGDKPRGGRLEGALSRLQRLNPFIRLLGLSATLSNRGELAAWWGAVDYHSTWRPVPLRWRRCGVAWLSAGAVWCSCNPGGGPSNSPRYCARPVWKPGTTMPASIRRGGVRWKRNSGNNGSTCWSPPPPWRWASTSPCGK